MNADEPLFIGIALILSEDQLNYESKKPTPSCFILQPLCTTYSPTNYHVESWIKVVGVVSNDSCLVFMKGGF